MKIGCIIHQQIMQLRWHFLACLGLSIALPFEEAIMNVREGEGFYATGLSLSIPVMLAPFLAGLIACANVQADLDDKRYVFWRSKPVRVKSFIALKYLVGMFIAFIVIALPVVFTLITCVVIQEERIERGFTAYIINWFMISVMTYSLCFLCNVLVRKTARAWLIGMAGAALLLLIPFILPLNFRDLISDILFVTSTIYLSIILGTSLIAFIGSLFAISRNWHLQTNLKGLLWTGATLIFVLMMLFTRQVANIKVLDEVKTEDAFSKLNRYGEQLSIGNQYIDIEDNRIRLSEITPPSEKTVQELREQLQSLPSMYPVDKELEKTSFGSHGTFYRIDGKLYAFRLYAYYKEKKIEGENMPGNIRTGLVRLYKKAHLRSFVVKEGCQFPVSVLDLSDCLNKESFRYLIMRVIDDKIVAFVGDQCVTVTISNAGDMKVISKNPIKRYPFGSDFRESSYKIPLVPTEAIGIEDRIRFSINFNFLGFQHADKFVSNSLVDIHGDNISFCLLLRNEIARYDVIKWDDEYVYCRFRDARLFTSLEQMFGHGIYRWSPYFVKDGKLYVYSDTKLLVFDVQSERIRKLGHFARISDGFEINDIEVLGNGQILMNARLIKGESKVREGSLYQHLEGFLYLLENPQ